ncbi:MAG: hypothetical protein KDM63_11055 [Verrucomicrobiae bacterium]|nr:hypothetical protein [Verrucomicrobiae bacterium]
MKHTITIICVSLLPFCIAHTQEVESTFTSILSDQMVDEIINGGGKAQDRLFERAPEGIKDLLKEHYRHYASQEELQKAILQIGESLQDQADANTAVTVVGEMNDINHRIIALLAFEACLVASHDGEQMNDARKIVSSAYLQAAHVIGIHTDHAAGRISNTSDPTLANYIRLKTRIA